LGESELGRQAISCELLKKITPAKTHDLTVLRFLNAPVQTRRRPRLRSSGKINPLKEDRGGVSPTSTASFSRSFFRFLLSKAGSA
jgi:hypothetical protein